MASFVRPRFLSNISRYASEAKNTLNRKPRMRHNFSGVDVWSKVPQKRTQHCWQLLRPFAEAKSLTDFKLCAKTPNNMQKCAQTHASRNVQQCCVRLHGTKH